MLTEEYRTAFVLYLVLEIINIVILWSYFISLFLGLVPLFGIDVWEHAYYLQYKNVRPDYVKEIFQVVNWQDVSERYQAAMWR